MKFNEIHFIFDPKGGHRLEERMARISSSSESMAEF